ncbi:hypothetical protein EK21DRAFT_55691, partial [Setomelanomma holmii]
MYRPLRETHEEIRLLDLQPAARLDDPLRGTLRHAKLHDAYCALSYVWGQHVGDKSNIAINSLAAALRHLRQKYGRITIWTDALCIDQMNKDEKSWQVPLMKSIYSEAKEVHAWLG